MKTKILVFLAIAGLSFAGTKSYEVTFGSPSVVGSVEVPSGQYKLSFEGSKVTLVSASTRKSVETTGTVQNSEKKFSQTVVQSKHVDGKDLVDAIQIGGTTTALGFTR